jgi:carbohydrate-selective porin OprB
MINESTVAKIRRSKDYKRVIELTYRFDFRKSAFFIQPDFQYIIHPGGTGQRIGVGCPVRHQLLTITGTYPARCKLLTK